MACNNPTKTEQVKTADFIPSTRVEALVHQLTDSLGEAHAFRVERGVKQVAGLWRETDGSEEDFVRFCLESFVAGEKELEQLYTTLERNFEVIYGTSTR